MKNKPFAVIGVPLKKIRKKKNITQEELADRCPLTREYISLLENDKKSPKLGTIFFLATGLEMKASEFVKEIEECLESLTQKHHVIQDSLETLIK